MNGSAPAPHNSLNTLECGLLMGLELLGWDLRTPEHYLEAPQAPQKKHFWGRRDFPNANQQAGMYWQFLANWPGLFSTRASVSNASQS